MCSAAYIYIYMQTRDNTINYIHSTLYTIIKMQKLQVFHVKYTHPAMSIGCAYDTKPVVLSENFKAKRMSRELLKQPFTS